MKKILYEFVFYKTNGEVVRGAMEMSKDGWELVSVCPRPASPDTFVCFFKKKARALAKKAS